MTQNGYDCVVCGMALVDIVVRPVPLVQAIERDRVYAAQEISAYPGGIVSNSGMALANLGIKAAALAYVGDDAWGALLRRAYRQAGLDDALLIVHTSEPTSAANILVDESGEHSAIYCGGADQWLNARLLLDKMDVFANSRIALFGYYPMLPHLLGDLPTVLAAIRAQGCRTALDAAGDGGSLDPLQPVLPLLDYYVPSWSQGTSQTGESDPQRILRVYRDCGARGLVGVKLGAEGALLSSSADQFLEVAPTEPPGPIVDTTGAGDCFFAGLIAGLVRGLSLSEAGKLASAAGASCITATGGSGGVGSYADTAQLAGVK